MNSLTSWTFSTGKTVTTTTTIADQPTSGLGRGETPRSRHGLGPWDVLALAAWLGLAAGWLEVGTKVLCKSLVGNNRLYLMTRHFVWLVPLSNLVLFLIGGVLLAAATKLWPRLAGWLSPRILCAAAVLTALMVAGTQIYTWAWVIVAAGISMRAVAWVERANFRCRLWLLVSFPGLLGLVPIMAAAVFAGDWLKEHREAARALPPADTPNVLLIVLDTVRADRMSLYGYERSTTPALERLAQRGIRFAEARATAPGPSLRTRPCSPAACPTISTCNGGRPCAGTFRRWLSSSGPGAMRRRVSSRITNIARTTRASTAASPITKTTPSI